jgi:hypothetical protein
MSKIQSTITTLEHLDSQNEPYNVNDLNHLNSKDEKIEIDDLRKKSIDLFISLDLRIKYLVQFHNHCLTDINYGFEEVISRITGMYLFSKTKNLEEYINEICKTKDISICYRIECAKCLEENGFHHINSILQHEQDAVKNLSTPIRIDTVLFLMKSDEFKEQSREYFCSIINDSSIEELYRFRTIQKLESTFEATKTSIPLRIQRRKKIEIQDKNIQKFIYYAHEACVRFIKNQNNTFTYRILACQYLFEKCNVTDQELVDFLEKFLLSVAEDHNLVDDLRADACDILLQYGKEEIRDLARMIIIALGGEDNNNIFKNKQNVHNRHIEQSVQQIVDRLVAYHPKNRKTYLFKDVKESILKFIKDEEKELKEKIEGSLIRISLDRAVYGNSNVTLVSILLKVWSYIQDSPFREELEKRLLEELNESNAKCSTGFASRLVNTLSGFDESMSISMGFDDQIASNLEGRLNNKIRDLENEEYMDKVLEEMTIPNIHYNLRSNFLRFFRENISKIRQEMYEEFRHYITDEDFDLYIKKAVLKYEGYN